MNILLCDVWVIMSAIGTLVLALCALAAFSRAQAVINKDSVQCDYWDFLDGINKENYAGTYMPDYEWSIETQSKLDILSTK